MAQDLAVPSTATVLLSSSLRSATETRQKLIYNPDTFRADKLVDAGWSRPEVTPALRAEAAAALPTAEALAATATRGLVASWLKHLGVLCAGQMTAEDAATKVGAYSSLLEYPAACFTRDTLKAAGAAFKWLPSFAELTEFLDEAAKPHRELADRLRAVAAAPAPLAQLRAPEPPPSMTKAERLADRAKIDEIMEDLHRRFPTRRGPPPAPDRAAGGR